MNSVCIINHNFFFKLQEGLNKEVKGDENVNNRLTKKEVREKW